MNDERDTALVAEARKACEAMKWYPDGSGQYVEVDPRLLLKLAGSLERRFKNGEKKS